MSIYSELKRRNVFRVAVAYLAAAWLLTEVSETLFPLFGFGDTPARIVVILLAICFPLFLIFSWVFEITPEGLKLEKYVRLEDSITPRTGKQLDRIITVVMALALGYFAFDKFVLEPVRVVEIVEKTAQQARSEAIVESYGEKSIAVLPFVNMSADPDQEYFSDGVSEELLNLLSEIPELRVISRSSSFSFKNKNLDIPTIAAKLNVAYILEGSVRKAGDRVRVTAQLIEARSDTHLWSETFDRELENIFLVQNEISTAITFALMDRLGLEFQAPPQADTTTSTEAHDAFLRGRYLVLKRTSASIEDAISEFEKAIKLDPNYALAYAELAMAISLLEYYGGFTLSEVIARVGPPADKALTLSPDLAEAQIAKGVFFHRQSKYEEALAHYERAIQINPNISIVYPWMSRILARVGRYQESFLALKTGLQLDPLSSVAIYNFVPELIYRDKLEEADRVLENVASIYPVLHAVSRGGLEALGGKWANLALGDLDGLRIDPKSNAIDFVTPFKFALLGLEQESLDIYEPIHAGVLSVMGKPGDAVTIVEARIENDPAPWTLREVGLALAAAGDYDRARPILDDLWQLRHGQVVQEGLFEARHAAALIAIRRQAGEEANVAEVLAAMKDNVRRYRDDGLNGTCWNFSADYEEGLAAYLSGESERGLALIAKAAEDGYFILPNEAYLQMLYDDPDFAPIMSSQNDRQSRERNRFLNIVCTENPYAAVWQPAEGTCERFLIESLN